MGALQLITITTMTVGKILICSLVGLFVSKHFVAPEQSVKGLSVISVFILLPCLLFSNLVLRVTWTELQQYYWAPLLACFPTAIGFVCSRAFRPFLHPGWHSVLTLGCTFQNGLTFSLAILLNIKGVSWLTAEEVERGESYVFLYNIVCSLGLWAIGEPIIRLSKKRLEQKRLCKQELQQHEGEEQRNNVQRPKMEATHDTIVIYPYEVNYLPVKNGKSVAGAKEKPALNVAVGHPLSVANNYEPKKITRNATIEEQLEWYRPGNNTPPTQMDDSDHAFSFFWDVLSRVWALLESPPIAVTIGSIIISLVPPLRWLAESPPGQVLIGGIKLIGAGAIPLQLLVLGCTVANARSPSSTNETAEKAGNGENDDEDTVDKNNGLEKRKEYIDFFPVSQSTLFAILTVILRLILIPTVCFVMVHFLRKGGVIPSDRVFLLSILLGTCAPSAINSSLICSMHAYKARPYAQMIFIMYVTAVATTALWLAFYIWYLGE
ncbi:putative transporter [Trypanosoma cruzi]|uniref:Transporter n=1 Tax=Trypanosoma cruzi Dm28c TaxID=1416333 RepID=V5BC60_TRYCR|nr:transporter [Trypanosoma cruzi Dm28c]PBJ70133.1 transporter [Trypanosoma cruzi cruzi]RNF24069.1 putative transporter [Trypanosoma cruzi]